MTVRFLSLGGLDLPSEVRVYRPLLNVWRSEVEEYCRANDLKPRTDSTNMEALYRRNRVRNELIPYLEREYSPALRLHLVKLAELARSEEDAIEEIARREADQVIEPLPGRQGVRLNRKLFASLPVAWQRRLIRRAIRRVAGTLDGITFKHVSDAVSISAGEAGSPTAMDLPHGLVVVRHDGWTDVRERESAPIALADAAARWPIMPPGDRIELAEGGSLPLDEGWMLTIRVVRASAGLPPPGELVAHFDWDKLKRGGDLVLRTRTPGDKIRPLGLSRYKRLQDLFVDAKIPRYVRDRLPLLCFAEGEVLWVPGPGGRRSDIAPVTADTGRILYLEFTLKREAEK